MSTIKDGGKAFPGGGYTPGMSLRDWFAGQALAGITCTEDVGIAPEDAEAVAKTAYALANAMIAAREPRP
jgi:hypothetical protein